MERIQVLLDPQERELFRRLAQQRGVSLSAWLRQAALKQSMVEGEVSRLRTVAALRGFFGACDAREVRREPDWEEHLAVLDASKREGVGEAGVSPERRGSREAQGERPAGRSARRRPASRKRR